MYPFSLKEFVFAAITRSILLSLKIFATQPDIVLGKKLEQCFQVFLEEQLNARGDNLSCVRADDTDLHMPDFKVVRNRDNHALAYFEFKVIFRPYLQIANRVNESFECYSHSLTLDLSNGKKLQEQRNRVAQQLGVDKVFYVYWYDLPCLKGVFWMPAKKVYEIMNQQLPYNRRNVAGDYNIYGRKNAATFKIYLPLLEMSDLNSLLEVFHQLATEEK